MKQYTTHCTECGSLLLEDEIAYQESGSLVSDQIELCEYCAHLIGYGDDLDDDFDFDDIETLFEDLSSYEDD